mmetsp:Transcript_9798/g.20592  ORF Transcript_9798/g.20592 Transcript_9798/m.20592 type:complete len:933 (+) Transcript_9798:119-2917(+)|eukprot:CAMPEP_0171409206 /NCGR_PEP_ID=MMETSP0880-20121228/23856_1 /TAXON_ID=67004 /ORGANISM="Thalassiosira weissflogii, Strain CCMP1336" /LENGTH=932 /DNA_ID=CAMNT_0011925637 /DNA_START=8 /DNA_END=2806 /DNA_ORIENTATION=+
MVDHHYAIDAAKLVDRCRSLLRSITDEVGTHTSSGYYLAEVADVLKCADRLVHTHLLDLLDREMEFLSTIPDFSNSEEQKHRFFGEHKEFPSLMDTAETVQTAAKLARGYQNKNYEDSAQTFIQSKHSAFGNVASTNSFHRRRVSTPPSLNDETCFSIEDPVEDDEIDAGFWYYGGGTDSVAKSARLTLGATSGRQSPPLSRNQNNGTFSNGTAPIVGRSALSIQMPSTTIQHEGEKNMTTSHSNKRTSSMHRRNFSTGDICSNRQFSTAYAKSSYFSSRSAKDSSLFRLIVTLQLLWVRMEEANSVLCKEKARYNDFSKRTSFGSSLKLETCSSGDIESSKRSSSGHGTILRKQVEVLSASGWTWISLFAFAGVGFGISSYLTIQSRPKNSEDRLQFLKSAGKVTMVALASKLIRKRWRIMCMNARLADSAGTIEDWVFRWICLVHDEKHGLEKKKEYETNHRKDSRKATLWYSSGSLRFQLIKRSMDLLYASFGKAVELTRGKRGIDSNDADLEPKSSGLWVTVVAALAASYYNVIGPASKSAQVVTSSSTSVIQNTWGIVSLTAVKRASLEATRILKGAAIADRIDIFGVSCFILSRNPFPKLTTALRKIHRQESFANEVKLSTIHEQSLVHPRYNNGEVFDKKDIILHLSGGGFFAHTIASDLPYLLDWSAATNAVVIIPEYSLLPHHKFPDALVEVARLYKSLRFGYAATILGFQPDRIVVSGESVGGNLAFALCVGITMGDYGDSIFHDHLLSGRSDREDPVSDDEVETSDELIYHESFLAKANLPDALLVCCPVLNMTLDSTPSRILGANDPVLPSGLVRAISNSYLPNEGAVSKAHPLVSPYFAPDSVLSTFPPVLIFTSYEDPFLDDSVNFNARLKRAGVNSSLRAVHEMPHAFWALSTAGIPEARQVQNDCELWLSDVLRSV